MANIFGTNNPGIGGLDEITDAEALFLQNLSSLPYSSGDILYHDGTNITRLAKGADGEVLTLASGIPSWATGGGGSGTPAGTNAGINVATLVANITLTAGTDVMYQYLNPSTANWTVTLDTASANAGDRFVIKNNDVYNSGYFLTIYQSTTVLDTIYSNGSKVFIFDGTNWQGADNGVKDKNVAIGYNAKGYNNGTAVGYLAQGNTSGAAVGYGANGFSSGAAVGYYANGYTYGTAVGRYANGSSYGTALGYYAGNGQTGSQNINIGQRVTSPTLAGNQQLNIGNVLYGTGMYNGTSVSSVPVAGSIGIGVSTITARLHLPAGTATASTAPLKLTSGINLTTIEDGAIEYDGTHVYASIGATRYQLDQQGTGDALTTDPLSQFAATTSLELAGVISDETGSGALVFGTSPTLVTPDLGTPSALVGTNITGSASGLNAGTATALETARLINGVSFDGTADITVTADAGTLTGTALNSTVVTSSLTSLGTIITGVWNGTAIADTYISSAVTWNAKIANVSEDTTPQLGGELDAQANSIGFTLQTYTGVVGTTDIDFTKGNKHQFTFGAGDETLTFTAPTKTGNFVLEVIQDATGGRTLTYPATAKWAGGVPPTLSTGASAVDVLSLYYNGTDYKIVASLAFA